MATALIDGNYYWVKIREELNWEIAKLETRVASFKDNDVFFFTDSRVAYVQDCFEIDNEPIKR